ncbi:MAG: GNAT family N-acetyltransferase [Dehalococcoidia bacterium]
MAVTIKLDRFVEQDASALFDQLRDVYAEVYAEPPYEKNEDDVAEFHNRYDQQVVRSGFTVIMATVDDELAGFSYGLSFEAGKWWRGAIVEPPDEIRNATKFAVVELVLRKPYRGHGLGRRMMNELLRDRPEEYAILLSNPKAPARRVYDRWGWQQVGTVRSYPTWPASDALVLPLRRVDRDD